MILQENTISSYGKKKCGVLLRWMRNRSIKWKVFYPSMSADFAQLISGIERRYSSAEKIILVMDNLNTHKEKSLINFYGEEKGLAIWVPFEVHYTPKHGSWLNQAEIAIGMYSRQSLGSARISDLETLRKKTKPWNRIASRKNVTINWEFTKKRMLKRNLASIRHERTYWSPCGHKK